MKRLYIFFIITLLFIPFLGAQENTPDAPGVGAPVAAADNAPDTDTSGTGATSGGAHVGSAHGGCPAEATGHISAISWGRPATLDLAALSLWRDSLAAVYIDADY